MLSRSNVSAVPGIGLGVGVSGGSIFAVGEAGEVGLASVGAGRSVEVGMRVADGDSGVLHATSEYPASRVATTKAHKCFMVSILSVKRAWFIANASIWWRAGNPTIPP